MPKTIYSRRDPLTEKELKAYEKNKRIAKKIREEVLRNHKDFDYALLFTEARAKGVCRTKFWGVNNKHRETLINWFHNQQKVGKFKKCSIKDIPFVSTLGQRSIPGVAIFVGK